MTGTIAKTQMMGPWLTTALVVGALATGLLALLYAYPVWRVLVEGFRWSAVSEVLSDTRLWKVGWFSLWQAGLSTLGVMLIAIPLAGILARREVFGRRVLLATIAAPFTLPTVVVASALRETLPTRFASGIIAIIPRFSRALCADM